MDQSRDPEGDRDAEDRQLEREQRQSRESGGDAPAAGSVEEREATAEGGGAFPDADEDDRAD